MRNGFFSLFAVWLLASSALGQTADCQFRWRKGDILTYRVNHTTTVQQTSGGATTDTSSRLELVKQWRILDVTAAGVATLKLTLKSLRNEQKTPGGEVLLFDSDNREKSTPALRKAMEKFVGKPLAIIDIDGAGRVLRVKKGQLERYRDEPPFQFEFPIQISGGAETRFRIHLGAKWQRQFTITLAPPLGTGEQFAAQQSYLCKSFDGKLATIEIKTDFPKLPKNPRDRIPLYQKKREGTVVFDVSSGRLVSVDLRSVHNLSNHDGAGGRYRFNSRYQESTFVYTKKKSTSEH